MIKEAKTKETNDAMKALIKTPLSEENIEALCRLISGTYPDVVEDFDNTKHGMYGFVLPFHRVTVVLSDGSSDTVNWRVCKIGRSIEAGLTDRMVTECRLFYKKNHKACVSPKIPGFDSKVEDCKQEVIKENRRAMDFVRFAIEALDTYPDLVFLYAGRPHYEEIVRERYGLPIGKWAATDECRKALVPTYYAKGTFTKNGQFKSKRGWQIWITTLEDQPGTANCSVGPTEFALMHVDDIKKCKDEFVRTRGWPKVFPEYVKQNAAYESVKECKIERWEGDDGALILKRA